MKRLYIASMCITIAVGVCLSYAADKLRIPIAPRAGNHISDTMQPSTQLDGLRGALRAEADRGDLNFNDKTTKKQEGPLTITDLNMRWLDMEGDCWHYSYKVSIKNTSTSPVYLYDIQLELYDKDGFLLEKSTVGYGFTLQPGEERKFSDRCLICDGLGDEIFDMYVRYYYEVVENENKTLVLI